MTPQELRDRTDRFSVDIITFCRGELPADVLKLRILTQLLAPLQQEASELLAILSASRKTAGGRRHSPPPHPRKSPNRK